MFFKNIKKNRFRSNMRKPWHYLEEFEVNLSMQFLLFSFTFTRCLQSMVFNDAARWYSTKVGQVRPGYMYDTSFH